MRFYTQLVYFRSRGGEIEFRWKKLFANKANNIFLFEERKYQAFVYFFLVFQNFTKKVCILKSILKQPIKKNIFI